MLTKISQLAAKKQSIIKHPFFLILILWLILTAINIDKAFHIDDTFHLEAAVHIKAHPLKPMSGLINWGNNPVPMHVHNQPPLFFYLIALCTSLFGVREIPLHLLLSAFTFLALYFFYKIARLLSVKNTRTLLLFFAFCPAFVVNQNIMTDVPVLALIVGSVYFLLKAGTTHKLQHYSLTALFLGLGLLIKYSVLPLLVVLCVVIISRRDYKKLLVLLIPIGMLCLWSFWNYLEYGSVHMFDRPRSGPNPEKLLAFVACLGAISAFSISLIYGAFPVRLTKKLIVFVLAVLICSTAFFYFDILPERPYAQFINVLFIGNGLVVAVSLFLKLKDILITKEISRFITSDSFVILLYLSAIISFLGIFAPFMATRHLLLAIPFILLFGHELISNATAGINRVAISGSVILGLGLGISDRAYADYYRRMASAIRLPTDGEVWTAGLWGWQWYAKQQGMKQYATDLSPVQEGDYLVYPGDVRKQDINENLRLRLVDKKWEEANIKTFMAGHKYGSLYSSFLEKPPWIFSKAPIDTIFIYRVEGVEKDTLYDNSNHNK